MACIKIGVVKPCQLCIASIQSKNYFSSVPKPCIGCHLISASSALGVSEC